MGAETLAEFEQEQEQEQEAAKKKPGDSQEAQIPPAGGNSVVKEPVVIIDGKERPLKNYEAELQRKHQEEIVRLRTEYEAKFVQPPQPPQPPQTDWLDQVYQSAEQEISTTGKAVPIKTIMSVANSISQRNLQNAFQTREQSEKTVRNFKRSVRNDPDWKDLEDNFDELVDQLEPHQINAPTLEVVLNSVRGKSGKDKERLAYERGKQEALKDTQILGAPEDGQPAASAPKTTLTLGQKVELDNMNKDNTLGWTEDEYKKALEQKRARFKATGARNIPQTLNDAIIK